MSAIGSHPHLRLVGTEAAPPDGRRDEVVAENRRAAANPSLAPTDPRWVLAVRAYSQLQGSTLTWDRRQRVLTTARQLGVRPFDANVIIAIVQDQARRGGSLPQAAGTIARIEAPEAPIARRTRAYSSTWLLWLAALAAAIAADALFIQWLTS